MIGPIHPVAKTGHFTKGAISLTVNGTIKQNSDLEHDDLECRRADRQIVARRSS